MFYKTLSSKNNPKIILYKKLVASKRFRKKEQKVALEGPHLVQEALKRGLRADYIFFASGYPESAAGCWLKEWSKGVSCYSVDEKLFKAASATKTPQPVAGVFFFNPDAFNQRLANKPALVVVLEELQDSGNIGTVIRTAAAAGAGKVYYTAGCADPFSPKALRASAGAIFSLQTELIKQPLEKLVALKQDNYFLVAAVARGGEDYLLSAYPAPVALLIGNETCGLSEEFLSASDTKVTILLKNRVESLNAAVAGGVLLFTISRRMK